MFLEGPRLNFGGLGHAKVCILCGRGIVFRILSIFASMLILDSFLDSFWTHFGGVLASRVDLGSKNDDPKENRKMSGQKVTRD